MRHEASRRSSRTRDGHLPVKALIAVFKNVFIGVSSIILL
jgi:hypothetical protein